MALFVTADFTSHAGLQLAWKVECDAMDERDWATLAGITSKFVRFGEVEGVPRGGLRFALAMKRYATKGDRGLLIVDDVFTTEVSMEQHRAGRDAMGVVAFSRNRLMPSWIRAVWQFGLAGSVL